MNNAQQINQDSGNTRWYTDQRIVEAARKAMGGIDLDPASDFVGNSRVLADNYFSEQDDGLANPWHGRVWMNHPFSRVGNPLWINKLASEYMAGNIDQACCITFASTSEAWFQPLSYFPQCYLSPRTNYYDEQGRKVAGVTKGSVVTYLGQYVAEFAWAFRPFGRIKIDYFQEEA